MRVRPASDSRRRDLNIIPFAIPLEFSWTEDDAELPMYRKTGGAAPELWVFDGFAKSCQSDS